MRVCQFRHFGKCENEYEHNSLFRKQKYCTGSEAGSAMLAAVRALRYSLFAFRANHQDATGECR